MMTGMEKEPSPSPSAQEKAESFVQLMRDTREEFSFDRARFGGPLSRSPFIEMLNRLERLDDPTKDVLRHNPEVLGIITDFETRAAGPLPDYGKRIRDALEL